MAAQPGGAAAAPHHDSGQQAVPASAPLIAFAVEGLLQSKNESDVEHTFWSVIWPQLETGGWYADVALSAPSGGGAMVFYPPQAASTTTSQPVGLSTIRNVLQHLQHNPQLLPAGGADNNAGAAQQLLWVGRPAGPKAATAAASTLPGIKVCENCGTTTTPLWRKDRQLNMMMCNACGIFFKHHQKHRPVELMLLPTRTQQHPHASTAPVKPTLSPAAAEDSEEEDGGAAGAWGPQRPRRRPLPPAAESDHSEQSDDDPEERRRSLRPRRARQYAEDYLHELRNAAAAGPTVAGGEEEPDAGAYDSEGGSDISSVQLLDEAAAERQRVELINRLVKEAFQPNIEGAIEGLKSLKQARITDPATGQSFGLVRLYADPGEPAAVSKPARPAAAAAVAAKPAKPAAHRTGGASAGAKPVQTCYNCNTTSTPLWRKERETGLMYCNACGIFKKTHGIERPLGTSRFKQYAGPGPQPRMRGKRSRGGGGPKAAAGNRRLAAGKSGSPDLRASDSELEEDDMQSGSDAEAEDEEHLHKQQQQQQRRVPAPAAAPAGFLEAAAATADDASGRRTSSGRNVRAPRNRLGEAAAVTSPDLAAAEAAQFAEYEAVEAIRRQQQLPAIPGRLSLFKSAVPTPPALPVLAQTAATGMAAGLPAPLLAASRMPAAQGTLSTSSDASAYSQPRAVTTAAALLLPGSTRASLPVYGVPIQSLNSGIDAGLPRLDTRLEVPGAPVTAVSGWPAPGQQQHWAMPAPLLPRYADTPPPGLRLQ